MDYPIVYDKFETAFTSLGLAVLGNANNVKIKEVINGEFLLSFILPRTDENWQYIQPENFIKVYDCSQKKDQLFRIRSFDEQRDSTGKLTSNIQCEHVYYDSHDCKFIPAVELIGQTPTQVLAYAFLGTRFTVGTIEITTPTDIFLDKVYPSEIVTKLIENVGGELIKDNWTINLVNKRGSNTGVEFRYGKNQGSLKRETDAKGVITRLYPFGKDGLQIAGSLGYIDSPLIGNYDRPRVGHIDYKDIEDPAELLTAAQAEWSTAYKDGIDKPKVTYSGEFIELKKLQEYGDVEAFGLGDIVKIIDEGLDADTTQRIMEYGYYPYEPKRSTVSLSNTKPLVYKNNRPSNIIGNTISYGRYVADMQTSSGDINSGWLDNIRAKLQTEINGMVQTALQHIQADIYLDNQTAPTKALILGPGLFAIANSKKLNGDWNWRTIATGDKVIADEVDALWVYAGNLIGNTITGAIINGGSLTVGQTYKLEVKEVGNNGVIAFSDAYGGPAGSIGYNGNSIFIDTSHLIRLDADGVTLDAEDQININGDEGIMLTSPIITLASSGNIYLGANNGKVYYNNSEIATRIWANSNFLADGNDDYVKSYTGQDLSLVATESGIAVRVNGVTLGSIFYD